jgi:integrase/recombinase XerD
MSDLRSKMIMDMELRGYSQKTIKNYIYQVACFARFFNKSPELLGEEEIRKYLHYCITERKLSEGTVNAVHASIKYLYTNVIDRTLDVIKIPRTKERRKLPVVLSKSEIKKILDSTTNLKHKTILSTIYSAGLRVSEAAKLKVNDIDSENMQIIIRNSKRKKDRYCILSKKNLDLLSEYWKEYKPKDYLFPGAETGTSISERSIQKVFTKSKNEVGIKKKATVHTLRHSFATHLLEAGTDICHIERLLGHTNIQTTTVYLHIRRVDLINIQSPFESLGE